MLWVLAGEKLSNTMLICFANELVILTSRKKTQYLLPLLQRQAAQTPRGTATSGGGSGGRRERGGGVPPISLQERTDEAVGILLDRIIKEGGPSYAAVYTPDQGECSGCWVGRCHAVRLRRIDCSRSYPLPFSPN